MNTTKVPHNMGHIISYEEQLIAIGGRNTATVEVHQNKTWNDNVIPVVGRNNFPLSYFSILSSKDGIYVFGKYVINKRNRRLIKSSLIFEYTFVKTQLSEPFMKINCVR